MHKSLPYFTYRNAEKLAGAWPKRIPSTSPILNPENYTQIKNISLFNHTTKNNVIELPNKINMTVSKHDMTVNMTAKDVPLYASTPTPLLITKLMDSIKNFVTTEVGMKKSEPQAPETLPLCDSMPPDLGEFKFSLAIFMYIVIN